MFASRTRTPLLILSVLARQQVITATVSFSPFFTWSNMMGAGASTTNVGKTATSTPSGPTEAAIVAGGCFWCIEAVFNEMDGVHSAISGYIGGKNANPTYEQVCDGETGHAEAVKVTYNPKKLAYKDILDIFFTVHDPTQLNRQGNDAGTQYRSAIFYLNDEQKTEAQSVIDKLSSSGKFKRPVVTTLENGITGTFYTGEEYHQLYSAKHPSHPYVSNVVMPKVHKARDSFPEKLKK